MSSSEAEARSMRSGRRGAPGGSLVKRPRLAPATHARARSSRPATPHLPSANGSGARKPVQAAKGQGWPPVWALRVPSRRACPDLLLPRRRPRRAGRAKGAERFPPRRPTGGSKPRFLVSFVVLGPPNRSALEIWLQDPGPGRTGFRNHLQGQGRGEGGPGARVIAEGGRKPFHAAAHLRPRWVLSAFSTSARCSTRNSSTSASVSLR